MKRMVVKVIQHLGSGGRWDTEVRLDDGSEFHGLVPGFAVGDEVEVSTTGQVSIQTRDGEPFAFMPKWVRAAIPSPLPGVDAKHEARLRPRAEDRYPDRACQDAWIQGAAWNVQGDRSRASVAEQFSDGADRDAALRGWDEVQDERRRRQINEP